MGFVEEYAKWIQQHIRARKGERRDRIARGHGHGERVFLEPVWWPLFGDLNDLHPEYEVADWRGRPYFIDFVWIVGQFKFAFEIKGYGPHVQNTDRTRYRRELARETYLQIMGFRVVSIPYDDLEEQVELTIFMPYKTGGEMSTTYSRLEREVSLLALRSNKPVRPCDLVNVLGVHRNTAAACLKSLCEKGKFRPLLAAKGQRVMRYEYVRSIQDEFNWW